MNLSKETALAWQDIFNFFSVIQMGRRIDGRTIRSHAGKELGTEAVYSTVSCSHLCDLEMTLDKYVMKKVATSQAKSPIFVES